jgi:hypothetical protein
MRDCGINQQNTRWFNYQENPQLRTDIVLKPTGPALYETAMS